MSARDRFIPSIVPSGDLKISFPLSRSIAARISVAESSAYSTAEQ